MAGDGRVVGVHDLYRRCKRRHVALEIGLAHIEVLEAREFTKLRRDRA